MKRSVNRKPRFGRYDGQTWEDGQGKPNVRERGAMDRRHEWMVEYGQDCKAADSTASKSPPSPAETITITRRDTRTRNLHPHEEKASGEEYTALNPRHNTSFAHLPHRTRVQAKLLDQKCQRRFEVLLNAKAQESWRPRHHLSGRSNTKNDDKKCRRSPEQINVEAERKGRRGWGECVKGHKQKPGK